MAKQFVTVFPGYRDFHFYKDPGQIPYHFSKLGYKASIVLYSDLSLLKESENNINLIRIPANCFNKLFNVGIISYLIQNARKISILNLFHLTWQSLLFAFIYKTVNPGGFVYLKMDASRYSGVYQWEEIFDNRIRPTFDSDKRKTLKGRLKDMLIRKHLVSKVDLWSVEDDFTRQTYESQYNFFSRKIITVYNGYSSDLTSSGNVNEFDAKENIILTVGRLGTFQKGTEILLEAFRKGANTNNYELHLAGSIEPEFTKIINKYFEESPALQNRVFFHGDLNRADLFSLYNRSKIFCMPSRFEGMAIVFAEAMYFRNAILSTPYVAPSGIIRDKDLGVVTENADPTQLAEQLERLINDEALLRRYADNANKFANQKLNWSNIVARVEEEITKRQDEKLLENR